MRINALIFIGTLFLFACQKDDIPNNSISVETLGISAITQNSAVSGGLISGSSAKFISGKGVCWSNHQNPTLDDHYTEDGTGSDEYISEVTNLNSDASYYARAYVILENTILYGNEIEFKTSSSVYNGSVYLENQEQVDSFGKLNYKDVYGWLRIGRRDIPTDITDLSGLKSITSVGYLEIVNNKSLTSLDGLQNLISISLSLYISKNDLITNLDELSNLKIVNDYIKIDSNKNLISLTGLQNTSSETGDLGLGIIGNEQLSNLAGIDHHSKLTSLSIWHNDNLPSLSQLKISTVDYLSIIGNSILVDLKGLDKLTSLKSELTIWENDQLQNLDGLQNISETQTLNIVGNDILEDLRGLSGLIAVLNEIELVGNSSLDNLTGLNNLTNCGSMLILSNPALNNLDALSNLMQVRKDLEIEYNRNLINFCGLKNLVINDGVLGHSSFRSNGASPTLEEIISNCQY